MIPAFIFLTLLVTTFTALPRVRAGTGPSDQPIDVSPPNFPGGKIAVGAAPAPFFKYFKPPFPTDSWWAGLTVSCQDAVLAGPFPFQSVSTYTGLNFGMSDTRKFNGKSIQQFTQMDWSASFEGLPDDLDHRKAISWDTQTVCLQYFNDGSTTTMDTCLVPGSPYMTFTYKNAAVRLTSLKGAITFHWVKEGTKAKVTTNGGTYLIYVIGAPINLNATGTTLISPPGFSGTLRLAKVKADDQEAILDASANTYPTGLVMTYKVQGDVSTQTWTWNVQGKASDLLLLSWPHHRRALQGPNMVNIQYMTLKGQMKGVRGNQWVLKHNLPTISWFPANKPHSSCLPELNKTLDFEVNALPAAKPPGETYRWGGSFARVAQLATIAEHVGRPDLTQKVVDFLKQSMDYWLKPGRTPAIAFETNWGGVLSTGADYFGLAHYNDHHFLYGYFLHGAAVIAKYDPAWLAANKNFFNHFARDIGNPSPNDPHYTVTRHMDWFAGHSWASGIGNRGAGRNQESSSEAINGYYGLLLWANVVKNSALIDYARMLIAIEVAGAQTYWQLHPKHNDPDTPYPEQGVRDLTTIGNVRDWEAGAYLLWPGVHRKIQIAAIQMLPVTPMGNYFFDADWMEGVLPYCKAELEDYEIGDSFKSVIYSAYTKVNPQMAYKYSQELIDWGTGNSASNTVYFISTQNSAADICTPLKPTPEGLYNIQDVASGKFVKLGRDSQLAATTKDDVLATKFTLAYTPAGGSIRASNGKFVKGNTEGTKLSAIAEAALSHETFRWAQQKDGTYELMAMVKFRNLTSTNKTDGTLANNAGGTTGVTPSKYRLIPTQKVPLANIPATGVLRSIQSNKYVVATEKDSILKATADKSGATVWSFEKTPDSPAEEPEYGIRSQLTKRFVAADINGNSPLDARKPVASTWEKFRFVAHHDAYIIVHAINGRTVALQPDTKLIDNSNDADPVALWAIE